MWNHFDVENELAENSIVFETNFRV